MAISASLVRVSSLKLSSVFHGDDFSPSSKSSSFMGVPLNFLPSFRSGMFVLLPCLLPWNIRKLYDFSFISLTNWAHRNYLSSFYMLMPRSALLSPHSCSSCFLVPCRETKAVSWQSCRCIEEDVGSGGSLEKFEVHRTDGLYGSLSTYETV